LTNVHRFFFYFFRSPSNKNITIIIENDDWKVFLQNSETVLGFGLIAPLKQKVALYNILFFLF
jgi:hypothetical protein